MTLNKTKIGDQIKLQRGKDITFEEIEKGDYPVISSSGISYYHNEGFCKSPGVVLGRKGSVGTVFLSEKDYWSHDTTLWVKDFKGNDPHYVYYFFKNISKRLEKLDAGSANPTLNRNHVYLLEEKWAPKSEQIKIRNFIKNFDNSIELYSSKKNILENYIKNFYSFLFKEFKPMKGKQNNLKNLYPKNFIETKLSKIPDGWSLKPITEFINFKEGKTFKDEYRDENGTVPVFGANGKIGYSTKEMDNDRVIFLGKIGSCGAINFYNGAFWATNNTFYIPKKGNKYFEYLRQVLLDINFNRYIGGSSNPYMPKEHFQHYLCLVPEKNILDYFCDIAEEFRNNIEKLEFKIKNLQTQRDILVKPLMSGEIKV